MSQITLEFTKTFTSGALKGLSVTETLRFPRSIDAIRWERGVLRNVERGQLNFTVSNIRDITSNA